MNLLLSELYPKKWSWNGEGSHNEEIYKPGIGYKIGLGKIALVGEGKCCSQSFPNLWRILKKSSMTSILFRLLIFSPSLFLPFVWPWDSQESPEYVCQFHSSGSCVSGQDCPLEARQRSSLFKMFEASASQGRLHITINWRVLTKSAQSWALDPWDCEDAFQYHRIKVYTWVKK